MGQWHWQTSITITILIVATLLPRVFHLDTFRAPDEDRWIARTAGFTRSLAHGQFDQLLQSPTPGITTHWLGAITIRYEDWQTKKIPIAIGQAILIAISGYLAWLLWGRTTATILTFLLALNPHLIAHSRIYGTDALMPMFIVISFLSIFLWHKNKSTRYLILSGLALSAATLSKLPGIIFSAPILLALLNRRDYKLRVTSYELRNLLIFSLAFLAGSILILPSLALAPMSIVGDFLEIFRSAEYTQAHTLGLWYYPRMLLLISTPLQLLSIALIPAAIYLYKSSTGKKPAELKQIFFLIISATIFFAVMSYGSKKGHRYLLPVFTLADVILAISISWLITSFKKTGNKLAISLIGIVVSLFLLQLFDIAKLYPHVMAYTNPITRPWFQGQGYGWGEGLDLAAAYLNTKPNAKNLTAASIYPNEFGHYFIGKTKPAHQHEEDVDYVVIYRNMLSRGPEAWETDVVNQYKDKQPEKIISFRHVPFVWIYNVKNP